MVCAEAIRCTAIAFKQFTTHIPHFLTTNILTQTVFIPVINPYYYSSLLLNIIKQIVLWDLTELNENILKPNKLLHSLMCDSVNLCVLLLFK